MSTRTMTETPSTLQPISTADMQRLRKKRAEQAKLTATNDGAKNTDEQAGGIYTGPRNIFRDAEFRSENREGGMTNTGDNNVDVDYRRDKRNKADEKSKDNDEATDESSNEEETAERNDGGVAAGAERETDTRGAQNDFSGAKFDVKNTGGGMTNTGTNTGTFLPAEQYL
uniref:Uncharacterized protein n=2 Tax=Moniliophthora roreri TaxID=221103 RepID=A0A0W0EVK9_MONRR